MKSYASELMLLKIKDLVSVTAIAGFAVYTINILGFPETSGYIAGVYAIFAMFFLLADLLPLPKDPRYDD
jgi:hypothetical protein